MEYVVRKISGRFKHLDDILLTKMKLNLKCLLKSWGAASQEDMGIQMDAGLPLWAEVEFLDNVVQFELTANPFLHSEVMNN